jgi:deoxyadenosine/deoxycytidine kinase
MSKLNESSACNGALYNQMSSSGLTGVVTIEGTIGAGKSTLKNRIEEMVAAGELGSSKQPGMLPPQAIVFVDEPVSVWDQFTDEDGVPILKRFYENPSQWAFSFQMMAYISRLAAFENARKAHPQALLVSERSLEADRRVFAQMLCDSGDINTIDFAIYTHWFDHFASQFKPDLIIYLRTPPEEAQMRVVNRARNGESPIDIAYLQRLEKYTDAWLTAEDSRNSCVVLQAFNEDGTAQDVDVLARSALVYINAAARDYNSPVIVQRTCQLSKRQLELRTEIEVATQELEHLRSQLSAIDAEIDKASNRAANRLTGPAWEIDAAGGGTFNYG